MPTITPTQLAHFRSNPQRSKLYMSVFKPSRLGYAVVGPLERGSRSITLTGFTGTLANIRAGMTLMVGTVPYADNLGRLRVKSIVGSTVTVGGNAVVFDANTYISAVDMYEIWWVPPKVTANGEVLEILQDYDIAYSDQNTVFEPIVMMGCGMARKDPGDVYFDGSASYIPFGAGTITTYAWEFPGSSTPTSSSATPGYITYPTAGYYWAHLTVTSSTGKSFTGHRPIIIHDSTNTPITDFELNSLSASWSGLGWSSSFKIWETLDRSEYIDRSWVVVWREDHYKNTDTEIGRLAGRSNLLFNGWLDAETFTRSYAQKFVQFEAKGTVPFMQNTSCYPVSLDYRNENIINWWTHPDLGVDRAVHYFLRWYTNALSMADFHKSDEPQISEFFDFEGENVSSSIDNTTYNKSVFVRFASDQYGAMRLEKEAQMSTGTITVLMDLTDADWREEEVFVYSQRTKVNWVDFSGLNYTGGPRDSSTPIFAKAPGDEHLPEGKPETITSLVLPDQEGTNQLAGLYLAWKNNPYPEVRLPMAGNWANAFDIIPQEAVSVTFNGSETNRGYVWEDKLFIVRGVTHRYDSKVGVILTDLELEGRTDGLPGITGDYPPVPPPPEPCDDCPPPCVPCTPCDDAYPCNPPESEYWTSRVYVATKNKGVYHTHEFSGPGGPMPTWSNCFFVEDTYVTRFIGDPYDPHKRQWAVTKSTSNDFEWAIHLNEWSTTEEYSWEVIQTSADILGRLGLENLDGCTPHVEFQIVDIHADINRQGYLHMVVWYQCDSFSGSRLMYYMYSDNYGRSFHLPDTQKHYILGADPGAIAGKRMEVGDCNGSNYLYVFGGAVAGDGFTVRGEGQPKYIHFEIADEGGPVGDYFNSTTNSYQAYLDPAGGGRYLFAAGAQHIWSSLEGEGWTELIEFPGYDLETWYSFVPTFVGNCGRQRSSILRASVQNDQIYWSNDSGATWHNRPNGGDKPDDKYIGISLIHSAKNYLYGIRVLQDNIDDFDAHMIMVVEHDRENYTSDPLLWEGKGGTDRSSDTADGIPWDSGPVVDILQVWTEGL